MQEPLSEKTSTYKAEAAVETLLQDGHIQLVTGRIVLYFKKDSSSRQPGYGTRIAFSKSLQPIKNSGNPGSFDYIRYMHFRDIDQQVYLQPGDYCVFPGKETTWLNRLLFASREKMLQIITRFVPRQKEAGMAEALLLGYKDDLDKTLVQSYSNTGVVHIIAISGMHLGLIYWLLSMVLRPLKKTKQTRWMVPVLIIAGLWLFALLTGSGPSILRAAVMFTCIVAAESLNRKAFIYNSLAASAFILLCINPFWLWDAGFQLSFTAVLSIVIFMKPIYHCLYFPNKIIDACWQLASVTLAAQLLTTPVAIYHFHQFPVYFLLTNLLAVPLSGLIILLEIFLCAVSFAPVVARPAGLLLQWLIAAMNGFVEHMETLPFSLWTGIQVNTVQVCLLYGIIAALAYWWLQKNPKSLLFSLACLLGFVSIRSCSFITANQQQQLVVYNLPKQQAIDFISGRQCVFTGTAALPAVYAQNMVVQQARTMQRTAPVAALENLCISGPFFLFNNKKIVLVDKSQTCNPQPKKIRADLIILSQNAPVKLAQLAALFDCSHFVLDASNSFYKVNKWKAEAANLHLYCFSVVDNGAFVMNMD